MARPTQQEIDEFNARMEEPDEEEDFEIEIFTPEGHGARLPYRKGRSYLAQHFGIDVGDIPTSGDNGTGNPAKGGTQQTSGKRANAVATGTQATGNPQQDTLDEGDPNAGRASQRYFGRRT